MHCIVQISILLILLGLDSSLANDVTGCGGFVVSSVSINYSPIKIKLYTDPGVLKFQTDCAPNNGYYFVPLYDHGDYVLRIEPPNGWNFDPMEVNFNFDGKTDICSLQTDINFIFKGFSIFGKVFSSGSSDGPSGVKVTLLSKANNNVIKHNMTSENGFFVFHDILPGQYIIEGSHDEWTFEQNRITVDVSNDNINLQSIQDPVLNDQIRVLGYSVRGKVVSDGQPINGVQFALFAKDATSSRKIACGDTSKPSFLSKLTVSPQLKYLCFSLSNAGGSFQLKSLPVGQYVLYTFYDTQNSRFEVTPSKYAFQVEHTDFTIEAPFQIGGFTIFGRVANNLSPQEPIREFSVSLINKNGKTEKTVNVKVDPSKGSFSADNVKTSKYIIQTTAPHYQFEDFPFAISPNSPNLPVIIPSKFEICGRVAFQKFDSKYKNVKLLVLETDTDKILHSVFLEDGKFCLYLPSGQYRFKIDSQFPELRFLPKVLNLKVNKPELDLAFEQFTASILGQVELSNKVSVSDGQLFVVLSRVEEPQLPLATANLELIKNNQFQFKFANVMPGDYVISLSGELASLFCWDKETISIKIIDSNIDNVAFAQKGVFLQISLSHFTNLTIQSPSGKKTTIDKSSIGAERIVRKCVSELGKYQISAQGCHKFSDNEQETFLFDTTSMAGQMLTLTAIKHRVTAYIKSASNLSGLYVRITVRSLAEQRENIIALSDYVQIESPNGKPLYKYALSFYERPMVDIRLEPVSEQLLFKPAFFEFQLKDDCYQNAVTFQGRFGLFINGQITPLIEDVTVNVFDNDTNEVIFSAVTDGEGKYSGGPFDDDLNLRIESSKRGYVFKQVSGKLGHFVAHQLCSISTTIIDQSGVPLSDVLVSIVSSQGENNQFIKNSIASSEGKLAIENLQPGEYFVRFMRKEYEFEPATQMLTLTSGDNHITQVVGKKVAFSCFGIVNSLNHVPEGGVVVEAIGLNNLIEGSSIQCKQIQEQALSEADGSFRILGLHPECQYAIRLKLSIDNNAHIRESIPRVHSVRVHDRDITDLRFVVLFKEYQMDFSASIKTDEKFVSSLTAQLFRQDEPNNVFFKQSLSSSPFVFFPSVPLDGQQYVIRIDSDLSTSMYQHSPIAHTFTANTSYSHFQFEFSPKSRQAYTAFGSSEPEISSNSLYSTILLIIICGLFYFNQQSLYLIKNFSQYREKWSVVMGKRNSNLTIGADIASKKKGKSKKAN